MTTTKKKRPSSMLRHGQSVIQSKTGGYDCVWEYQEHHWKRKYVMFNIVSVNGELVDWVNSHNKYPIAGWLKPKFLDTFIVLNRSTFNMLVESGAYTVIRY
jgi:hypothetical protein